MPGTFGEGIKSVQRGRTLCAAPNPTVDVTVTAVDVAKSFMTLLSNDPDGGEVYLLNSTTVRCSTDQTYAGYSNIISWELVEFY
jgi:hypothetical protein